MIFDIFITLCEDIILSFSVASIVRVKNSIFYILLTSIFCSIETFIFSYIYINNILLLLFIVITHAIVLLIFRNKNIVYNIIIVFLLMILLLVSNYLSLYIFSIIEQIPILEISKNKSIFNASIIFSKLLFAISSFFLCKYIKKNQTNDRAFEKNKIIFLIIINIALVFTLLAESLIYNRITNITILTILVQLIILSILFFILYNRLQLENKEKIELVKSVMELEYLKMNSEKINKMYDIILKKEHDMIYVLRKIKSIINEKEAIYLIESEIDKIISYKFIANTGNSKFDHDISNKINLLKDEGYDIKVIMMLHYNPRLNEDNLIIQLIDFIDKVSLYSNNKKIEFRIKEKNDTLIIKAISVYKECENINKIIKNINGINFEMISKVIYLNDD